MLVRQAVGTVKSLTLPFYSTRDGKLEGGRRTKPSTTSGPHFDFCYGPSIFYVCIVRIENFAVPMSPILQLRSSCRESAQKISEGVCIYYKIAKNMSDIKNVICCLVPYRRFHIPGKTLCFSSYEILKPACIVKVKVQPIIYFAHGTCHNLCT